MPLRGDSWRSAHPARFWGHLVVPLAGGFFVGGILGFPRSRPRWRAGVGGDATAARMLGAAGAFSRE